MSVNKKVDSALCNLSRLQVCDYESMTDYVTDKKYFVMVLDDYICTLETEVDKLADGMLIINKKEVRNIKVNEDKTS